MVFFTPTFMYMFLPLLIIFNLIFKEEYKKIILLIFSIIFCKIYLSPYFPLIIISSIVNYILSNLIEKRKHKKLYLISAICYNVLPLLVINHTNIIIKIINKIFKIKLLYISIHQLLFIPFLALNALNYIIDVYKNTIIVKRTYIDFICYYLYFPKLLYGPLPHYKTLRQDFNRTTYNINDFHEGIKKIILGIGQMIILYKSLNNIYTSILTISFIGSWIKPIIYTLKTYYFILGYITIVRGISLIFGIQLKKQISYPLFSVSISNAFSKSYKSVETFFIEHVYKPLGSDTKGMQKTIRNIFLTGLALVLFFATNINTILTILYFTTIIIIEKIYLGKKLRKLTILNRIYTIFTIILGFTILSSPSISTLFTNIKLMFRIKKTVIYTSEISYIIKHNIIILTISSILATPLIQTQLKKIRNTKLIETIEPVFYIIILVLATPHILNL